MDVTLLVTCSNCPGTLVLKEAATNEGYSVTIETVKHSDDRTFRSAELGIGIPVLVREDGLMSDDGKNWRGEDANID